MNLLGIMRRTRGLSQLEVGRAVGISAQAVSDFEHGLRPSPPTLGRLASFFRVPEQDAAQLMREVDSNVVEDLPRTVLAAVGAAP
jgi:transcriptional regulator with XRE-family HTH domain